MFAIRRPLRSSSFSAFPSAFQPKCRLSSLSQSLRTAATPLAKQLDATGLWHYGRWEKKGVQRPKGDKNRVNIVDEKLCDDVISYLGPSLQRHVGCDLIDIYPGAGLWSSKLHEVLQPRTHIMMEPDVEVYTPFLKDLLAKSNTRLVPTSGIVWRNLNKILNPTYLPHQVERVPGSTDVPERNDTLLVVANLSFYPPKKFQLFDSVARLVLFQLVSSIRASSLFQKYGLVRMLFWSGSEDKNGLLGRSCQRRRRMAIEGEISTDWIMEICGPDLDKSKGAYLRDHALDLAGARNVLAGMTSQGLKIPKGRESALIREVLAHNEEQTATLDRPFITRPYVHELAALEAQHCREGFDSQSVEYKRMMQLKHRATRDRKQGGLTSDLLRERDAMVAAIGAGMDTEEIRLREQAWNEEIQSLNRIRRIDFTLMRDNWHLFNQNPPVLSWDRRELEPLIVKKTEFFPNVPCSLVDIQPKAMHPQLRAMGRNSNRAGDIFEVILSTIMQNASDPISKVMDSVWPGAAKGVLPHCPSLRDPATGGVPLSGYGELAPRTLNEAQWVELLEAWMKWPFRPSYTELVSRTTDESGDEIADMFESVSDS